MIKLIKITIVIMMITIVLCLSPLHDQANTISRGRYVLVVVVVDKIRTVLEMERKKNQVVAS